MTKLAGDHVLVLVDGYDLTGDHNKIQIDDTRNLLDVTTFGDAVHKFIPGQRKMMLDHSGWLNADSARSHPVLNAASLQGVISVMLGQNATPIAGDPVYSLETLQTKYSVAPEFGQVVPFGANFGNQGSRGGWGVALATPTEFTNTSNGNTIDNGAASSNGGSASLHVLTAAGSDTYSIVLEGSTTGTFGGEETTIATFSLDASSVGSERVSITGTLPRYMRWNATRTGSAGDTIKIAVSLIRY